MANTRLYTRAGTLAAQSSPMRLHRPFSSCCRRHANEYAPYPPALPADQRRNRNIQNIALNSMTRGLNKNTRARQITVEQLERAKRFRDTESYQKRRWAPGDIYAPHDLSPTEMKKLARPGPARNDPFKELGVDPLSLYKNFSVMAEFCTPMMRIKSRFQTGLGNVTQRKLAKAVRRSIGMGLMPAVHVHPEVVEKQRSRVNQRWFGMDGRSGQFAEKMG